MDLRDLEAVLGERLERLHAGQAPPGSYSVTLLADSEKARRKIMEEAFELCLELGREPLDEQRVSEEAADLLFHVLAGLVAAGVSLDQVMDELERRRR